EDPSAELEGRGTQTLHRLPDVVVAQRRNAGPRAALAERRREDELERRALTEPRMLRAQVVLELSQVQPGEDAVEHELDARLGESVDARDGLVMGVFPRAEQRGARRRYVGVQRDDRALEALLDGSPHEAVLREGPAVRVDVPREAVDSEPSDDRPEA